MKVNWTYFTLKTSVLLLILASLPLTYSIPVCLFVTWGYQYVIALVFGWKVMPTMDTLCFVGTDKARANIMSIFIFEQT